MESFCYWEPLCKRKHNRRHSIVLDLITLKTHIDMTCYEFLQVVSEVFTFIYLIYLPLFQRSFSICNRKINMTEIITSNTQTLLIYSSRKGPWLIFRSYCQRCLAPRDICRTSFFEIIRSILHKEHLFVTSGQNKQLRRIDGAGVPKCSRSYPKIPLP